MFVTMVISLVTHLSLEQTYVATTITLGKLKYKGNNILSVTELVRAESRWQPVQFMLASEFVYSVDNTTTQGKCLNQ